MRVTGKVNLDLRTDPPPDLAIEVEVGSSLSGTADVYQRLGVPDLWRARADASCDLFQLDAAQCDELIGQHARR